MFSIMSSVQCLLSNSQRQHLYQPLCQRWHRFHSIHARASVDLKHCQVLAKTLFEHHLQHNVLLWTPST